MTTLYWDASAMVKHYRSERGSVVCDAIFAGKRPSEVFASCSLLTLEMQSAASRGLHARELSQTGYVRMLSAFSEDYAGMRVVPLSLQLAGEANEYVRLYQLKALDALHFAATMRLQQAMPPPTVLVTSDHDLVSACARAGLIVLDPTATDALQLLHRLR